jgi:hypothetical protein
MEDLQSTLNHLWDAGFAGDRTDARGYIQCMETIAYNGKGAPDAAKVESLRIATWFQAQHW